MPILPSVPPSAHHRAADPEAARRVLEAARQIEEEKRRREDRQRAQAAEARVRATSTTQKK